MKVLVPQGPAGWGLIGEIRVYFFKAYSSRMAQQNVTQFDVKHHWGKRQSILYK